MATLRVPSVVPSPTQDSEKLYKAFEDEGWGSDHEAIIWVLARRNACQRKLIKDTYQQLYNESLIDRLNSELSGDFREAMTLWMYDPPERDARLAREALKTKKKGTHHLKIIVEMTCAMPPDHLIAVRKAYSSLFECSLEEDIELYVTSPPLKKLLTGLVRSYRYDRESVDSNIASMEADTLHEFIETKQIDTDKFVWPLATRNIFQLRKTFECYLTNYGTSIDQDIKKCSSNQDLESLLCMVVCCIDYPEKHFVEVIREAIIGLGTDEDSLNRAVISRAEVDMMRIKSLYPEVDKSSSLEDAIAGDTSGSYKNFLLTLIGSIV